MLVDPFMKNNLKSLIKYGTYSLSLIETKCKLLIKYGTFDFFDDVNIEINTSCNRRCEYCPNSVYDRGLLKNEKLMNEEIFKKIINQLAEIKFDGRISPHFYGEPLLDKRIITFVKFIREKLPKSKISIYSNGDFLTVEKYEELVHAGVNLFVITQHSKEMNKNIKELFKYLKNNRSKKIIYEKITSATPLYNRGGLVKPIKMNYKPRCSLFDNPLIIDHAGNVLLCCNDYHSSIKFGNINEKNLLEIWNSTFYKEIRKQIKNYDHKLDICQKCVGLK
ncbi:Coenzyme PQQ synthesis protein E [uncultured archaeon]|nr:Coenzyme PQQ synthesis protein E [uncultured archaeon]